MLFGDLILYIFLSNKCCYYAIYYAMILMHESNMKRISLRKKYFYATLARITLSKNYH